MPINQNSLQFELMSEINPSAPSSKRKKRILSKKGKPLPQNSFNDADEQQAQQTQQVIPEPIPDHQKQLTRKQRQQKQSQQQLRNVAQQQTMGQSVSNGQHLPMPYQFLKFASPPLRMIFLPRFAFASLSFVITCIFLVCFIILLIYNYTRAQNDFTWNCSVFHLQNKYFPRLRYNYELWRVAVSSLFHSNIAHFVLNLFGLQIYSYFVEWYYGKLKLGLTLLAALILAHFMSCVATPTSVSTTSSSILFSIIGLKIIFLYEYRDYKPLQNRRVFVYLLLGLITAVNLIPIFVVNNVDYGAHISGLIVGLGFGLLFHMQRQQQKEQLTIKQKFIKYIGLIIVFALIIAMIATVFTMGDDHYRALNDNIDAKCIAGQ